ncbi:MAG TPA: cell division protein FtsA, partial [Rhodanobacteraceae bacterium]
GASRIEGAQLLAEEVFHKMVRLGVPQHVTGATDVIATPANAAGIGLLLQGSRLPSGGHPLGGAVGDRVFGALGKLGKAKSWLSRNF